MPGPTGRTRSTRRAWGWVPDLPDRRDWAYVKPKKTGTLPGTVDLRWRCSPVEDQGTLGSCTAQALAGALEFLGARHSRKPPDLSRLFIYFNERRMTRTTREDSGASLRDGIKTLVTYGACAERLWPYVVSRFTRRPTPACYADALDHQITEYRRIESTSDMKACLADGFPFVFGFTVYQSLESRATERTGNIPMPARRERALGGHAVLAVGYDDGKNVFIIRNSWGDDWGARGYGTIPYGYLESRDLSDDFWTIRAGEGL